MRFGVILTVATVALLVSLPAMAADPCHDTLGEEALDAYDDLVGSYLEAVDENDAFRKLEALDNLLALCDANLRLRAFRADAYAELNQCEAATEEYYWIIDHSAAWEDRAHAEEANTIANEGLAKLRDSCIASVSINCATPGSMVQIGERPAQTCPAELEVSAGTRMITVFAEGMAPVSREYPLRAGNNFVELEALSPLVASGRVSFKCDEPGTRIVVGPQRLDCPTTLSVPPGDTPFRALRRNGNEYNGSVNVSDGGTATVLVPASDAQVGGIKIECSPADAKVVVKSTRDKVQVGGGCPFSSQLATGEYAVVVSADGYSSQETTFTLTKGETLRLQMPLEEGSGLMITLRAVFEFALGLSPDEAGDGSSSSSVSSKPDSPAVIGASFGVGFIFGSLGLNVGARSIFASTTGGNAWAGVAGLDWYVINQQGIQLWAGISGIAGQLGIRPCDLEPGTSEGAANNCVSGQAEEFGAAGGLQLGLGYQPEKQFGYFFQGGFYFGTILFAQIGIGVQYGL